jgi:hypothetical protein
VLLATNVQPVLDIINNWIVVGTIGVEMASTLVDVLKGSLPG